MPIPLLAGVALGAAGINAAGGLFKSAKQKKEAKGIDTTRPKYKINQEIVKNKQMYQNLAQGDMAGYGTAKSEIQDATANTVGAINRQGGSASQQLAAIAQAGQTQSDAMTQLAMQNAQAKEQNMAMLAQARGALADEQRQAFQFNKAEPYLMNLERKRALETASQANFTNAFQGITNAATGALPFIGK